MKESITMLIANQDMKLALQLRDDKKELRYSNSWVFPGGGIDTGEIPEAAALREFQEEFGISTSIEEFSRLAVYEHDNERDYLIIYHGKVIPQNTFEGQVLQYFSFEDIEKLALGFHQNQLLPFIKSAFHEK